MKYSLIFFFCILLCGLNVFAVQPEELNQMLGIPLFPETGLLWEEPLDSLLQRLEDAGISFPEISGNNNLRVSDSGQTICGADAIEFRLLTKTEKALERIDIIYANKGDSADNRKLYQDIRHTTETLKQQLSSKLGKGNHESGTKLKGSLWEWDMEQACFQVEFANKEYVILHIQKPQKIQDQEEDGKPEKLKNLNLAGNVRRNRFGDTYIRNIPMVNQGYKGYCVPATMERILLYYGITEINMHQIARASNTGRGGGTQIEEMHNILQKSLKKYGVRILTIPLNLKKMLPVIQKGYPILWAMCSSEEYEKRREFYNAARKKAKSSAAWGKEIRQIQAVSTRNGEAHVCLITGINPTTEEVAVSNSWGEDEMENAWIPFRDAERISQGFLYYYPVRD